MITADSYAAPSRLADSNVLGHDTRMRHQQSFNLNPEFALTRPGYHVRLADNAPGLRPKVRQLVTSMYGARGLDTANSSPPRRPGQLTLAACCGDRVFGTLTLGADTPDGLLADTLYRAQIDEVRAGGGRVCEVTRLAMDSSFAAGREARDALETMFNLVFLLAHKVHRMTDLFIEVHPRHAGYYRRMVGYRVAGPVLTCPRVRAPAVLMHLDLDYAETQLRRHASNPSTKGRNIYRQSMRPTEHQELMRQLLSSADC